MADKQITLEVVSHGLENIMEQIVLQGKEFNPENIVVRSEMIKGKLHIYLAYPTITMDYLVLQQIKDIMDRLKILVPEDVYRDVDTKVKDWLRDHVKIVKVVE